VGHPKRAEPLPDVLLNLDEPYAGILAPLDGCRADKQLVSTAPDRSGPAVARVGEPGGADGGVTVQARVPA
jgi:hypothetical protein